MFVHTYNVNKQHIFIRRIFILTPTHPKLSPQPNPTPNPH